MSKIQYITGNILEAQTDAIINTVNCEGYMGKGLAYQFKNRYPEMNQSYVKACKTGELKIGNLHTFDVDDKKIINFPTKNKWRPPSKMEYIEIGLDRLAELLEDSSIRSIAIPPLGSGNGGLKWSEVKQLIEKKLGPLSSVIEIVVYEPSRYYPAHPVKEPNLSLSALIIMRIRLHLKVFNALRLQKASFFMNIFAREEYFKFTKYKYGPYANSIDQIAKRIKEFQTFHGGIDTEQTYSIVYNKLTSKRTESKLQALYEAIVQSTAFVNEIESDHLLECISTISYILLKHDNINEEQIINEFHLWSNDKARRFKQSDIMNGIEYLVEMNIIHKNLIGYNIVRD